MRMIHGRTLVLRAGLALAVLSPAVPCAALSPAVPGHVVAQPPGAPAADGDATRDDALNALLDAVYGPDRAVAGTAGRELLESVLARPAFVHKAVGPFDLYVYQSGALATSALAKKTLEDGAAGLAKAADVIEKRFNRSSGLVSGRRFPLVLTASEKGAEQ